MHARTFSLFAKTTTVEYCHRLCDIDGSGDNVELHLIDSAGQETFLENSKKLWTGASYAVYVYDTSDDHSFAAIEAWVKECKAVCGNIPGVSLS